MNQVVRVTFGLFGQLLKFWCGLQISFTRLSVSRTDFASFGQRVEWCQRPGEDASNQCTFLSTFDCFPYNHNDLVFY
jgi:hypothetical protein